MKHRTTWHWQTALLLLGIAVAQSAPAAAQPAVVADPDAGRLDLGAHAELLEDAFQRLDAADLVEAVPGALSWFRSPDAVPNFGYSRSTFWSRVRLHNPAAERVTWWLEVDYPPLDHVALSVVDELGTRAPLVAGDSVPHAQWPLPGLAPLFPVTLAPGATTTLLVAARTEGTLRLPLVLWQPDAWAMAHQRSDLALGLFFGLLVAMWAYNLFLGLSLRDRSYGSFLVFLAAIAVFALTETGVGYALLWPAEPWWAHRAALVSLGVATVAGVAFARRFLRTPLHVPRLDLMFVLIMIGAALLSVAPLIGLYRESARAITVLDLVAVLGVLVAALVAMRRQERAARYFLIAWGAFLLGAAMSALVAGGMLPVTFVTSQGVFLGGGLVVLLLSIGLADRIRALRADKEAAEHIAVVDALTGVANRRRLDETIEAEWRRALRGGTVLSLIMVDIDFFKRYNDLYGHVKGDACLRMIAEALHQELKRPGDLIGRYGGEEFGVVLPETDSAGATFIARRLQLVVETLQIPHQGSTISDRVTISIGVATAEPHPGMVPSDLIAAADQALYDAKHRGRNQAVRRTVAFGAAAG